MGRLDMRKAAAAVLTALALIPYALGWTAGAIVRAASWTWSALVVGWHDGRKTNRKEQVS